MLARTLLFQPGRAPISQFIEFEQGCLILLPSAAIQGALPLQAFTWAPQVTSEGQSLSA